MFRKETKYSFTSNLLLLPTNVRGYVEFVATFYGIQKACDSKNDNKFDNRIHTLNTTVASQIKGEILQNWGSQNVDLGLRRRQ